MARMRKDEKRGNGIGVLLLAALALVAASGCGGPAPAPEATATATATDDLTPPKVAEIVDQAAPASQDATSAEQPAPPVSLNDIDLWSPNQDGPSSIAITSVPGQQGQAMEIAYDLKGGKWVDICFGYDGDLSGAKGLRFVYKCVGKRNTLELKVETEDYSNFGTTFKTDVADWTPINVPFNTLKYLWGDSKKLVLSTGNKIHFAISSSQAGDEGGSGKVLIEQIEVTR